MDMMRERLIALLQESSVGVKESEWLANSLLLDGVIVPPCKMGDIVYMVTPGGKIHEKKVLGSASVVGLNLRDEIWMKHSFTCESALVFNEDDIGKTVFRTHKEAEQALKGGG